MPSNYIILYHLLLLLPSIFPSIRVFSSESVLHIRWPQYWNFSFSISLSNEYSGFISFRIDWFDLLAVQGTLNSHCHHQSSKASIPWWSAFFPVQLSHLYMTTGKTIGLTRQTFVSKAVEQHESTICIYIYIPSLFSLSFLWVNLLFICLCGKSPRTYIWSGNLFSLIFRVICISQNCCPSPLISTRIKYFPLKSSISSNLIVLGPK